MTLKRLLISMAMILTSASLPAGTITSGGGLSLRYAQNPWWLENTPIVHYCIDMDPAYFDYTESELDKLIQETFIEWRQVFTETESDYIDNKKLAPYYELRVATQKFVRTECTRDTDLRFQLGKITEEQKALFLDIRDYIGVAVRTEYDLVNMRGKGFIYISPLNGELAPTSPHLDDQAWSKEVCGGCILRTALRHEIGHLFGMRDGHRSSNLMDEGILDGFTRKMFTQRNLKNLSITKFNNFYDPINLVRVLDSRTYEGCEIDDGYQSNPISAPSFWEAPKDNLCGKIVVNRIGDYSETPAADFDFYSAPDPDSPYKYIGTLSFHGASADGYFLANIDLPENQQVFPYYREAELSGEGAYSSWRTTATYTPASGRSKPVHLKINVLGWEERIDTVGFFNGTLESGLIDLSEMNN
jgi:hypothetical protein